MNDDVVSAKFSALEEGHGELISFLLARVEMLENKVDMLQQRLDGESFGNGNIQM